MINYSFIIPHKNCPDLLKRCVDSIPIRDDVQIIVVDDNSDDSEKPTVQRRGIEIVFLDVNNSKGAGRARNVGLEKAVGKWLLFPDSDDYYVEGFLDVLDGYLLKNVDVVYFNCEYRDGKTNELLSSIKLNKDFELYDESIKAKDRIKFHHNSPWTKMIRSDYVKQHNFRFEEVPNGNDILFTFSLGSCTDKIEVITEPLYVYLRNKNSLTQKKQTEKEAFCVLLHTIQQNSFYKYIGYPEWRLPLSRKLLYYVKVCGLSFFFIFFNRLITVIKHRDDFKKKVEYQTLYVRNTL